MDTVKLENKNKTLMVAHRGASGLECENTLPAFVAAGNRSYYGMECDVHVTKDGKYVIYHDDETGRICDKNVIIEQTDFAELRSLKLRATGTDEFSEALRMLTLEEYLDISKRYGKVAVIELKNAMTEKNIREIIEICKSRYDLKKIVYISFCFENLVAVRKFEPYQKVQFLTGNLDDETIDMLVRHKFDIDVHFMALDKEKADKLHANGIEINCWTCDDKEAAALLIDLGVDYITTDILE